MIWKINSGLWAVVWAGLWNKRVWADYEQLLRPVFSLFWGQFFFKFHWKHYSIRTEKLHNTFFINNIFEFVLTPKKWKKKFFRAKNLSVNTRRSGPGICSLICCVDSRVGRFCSERPWIFEILTVFNFDCFSILGKTNEKHFPMFEIDLIGLNHPTNFVMQTASCSMREELRVS